MSTSTCKKAFEKEISSWGVTNAVDNQKKMEDNNFELLLNTISIRLHKLGKIKREGHWVLYELPFDKILKRFDTVFSLFFRLKRRDFLHKIVTGKEWWVFLQ